MTASLSVPAPVRNVTWPDEGIKHLNHTSRGASVPQVLPEKEGVALE
jgi:hypothetical protein